jgi:hypothetical protein
VFRFPDRGPAQVHRAAQFHHRVVTLSAHGGVLGTQLVEAVGLHTGGRHLLQQRLELTEPAIGGRGIARDLQGGRADE